MVGSSVDSLPGLKTVVFSHDREREGERKTGRERVHKYNSDISSYKDTKHTMGPTLNPITSQSPLIQLLLWSFTASR